MRTGTRSGRSAAEWVTLSLSVLVVGALLVVAIMEESRRQERDGARVEVSFAIERSEARGGRYYVPYTVRNTGSVAITSAEIWIDIYAGDRVAESAEVTVEFLPLHGTQDGMFIATRDPSAHAFVGRVESLLFP